MGFHRNRAKPARPSHTTPVSLMGKAGLNFKDLAEFINPSFALKNINYFVQNNRGLSKRKGIIKLLEIAGTKPITMLEQWKGYYIFGYDKTVAAYNPTTRTVTNIKTNWTTADKFSGAPYGDYFFVGNAGDKIHYITESSGVFTITSISAAPKASIIRAIGPRLFAAVENKVYYCNVDDGTDPPFTGWTVDQTATTGGIVSFRNAGTINSICSIGDIVIAFGNFGKWAFRIATQSDGTGTVVKVEEVVIDRIDMGGASGAITTPKGVFYVNEAGLWQLMSLGQSNVPYSDQEMLTSINLGTEYFKDIDLTNADIIYYGRYSTILVTCARESAQNNHVITYNPDVNAFSEFRNWNVGRWMSFENEIYAGSSIKTALYYCFNGNSDDGVAISTEYLQELKCGDPWNRQQLYGQCIKGLLHPLSVVNVAFDIYDVDGNLVTDKLQFYWTAQTNLNKADGWGTAQWGKSSWGGDLDNSGLIESFAGHRQFIRNFQRIRVHITESSTFAHQIDWFSLDARTKAPINPRNLTLHT